MTTTASQEAFLRAFHAERPAVTAEAFGRAGVDLSPQSLALARTRGRDGLDEVLGPVGFGPVGWETVPIDLSGPVEEVWAAV